jgi:hypothetical protein
MIQTDYIITCDRCENRHPLDKPTKIHSLEEYGPVLIGSLWKRLTKAGWARVNGRDCCPICVRSLSADFQRKAYKPRTKKDGKLSKTAREALAQRRIDDGD